MNYEAILNGETYIWTGTTWLTAAYTTPPRVVVDQLNSQFHHLTVENSFVSDQQKRPKRTRTKQESTIQAFIAPIIADIIHKRHEETNAFVTRAEIVDMLLAHEDARFFLQEAHQRTPGHFTFERYVGNQVDFFSKGYEEKTSEYSEQFEQEKIDGCHAYKPISPQRRVSNI